MLDNGKSYLEIAIILGISKSMVGKIALRIRSVSTADGEDAKDAVDGVDTQVLAAAGPGRL